MRRLPAVLAALLAAALVLLAAPAWAAPTSRSFDVTPELVRAGQEVKVFGTGCNSQAFVRIYIDGIQMATDRADRLGRFKAFIEMPTTADLGEHRMKASCSGRGVGFDDIVVRRSRFNVSPRILEAGDNLTTTGSLCKAGSLVSVKVDGRTVGYSETGTDGRFRKTKALSSSTAEGRHVISSRCGGRFVGAMSVRVTEAYPSSSATLLTTDRSSVPAGQTVTLSGADCPTGQPTASLDGQRLALAADRSAKGKGFTATATIPGDTTPGRHQLWAGCDAGAAGTTELDVLDPATVENAAATRAFGPSSQDAGAAMIFGLMAGVALLAASVAIARRRS
jgi:hypothetical protein